MSRSDAEIRFVAIAVALSVLLVGAVWCVDYLPTNDGPQHVFLGYASRHIDDIDKGYGRYLEPNPALTGVGFDALYGVFLIFLPWRPAVSLVLTVMTLLWAWGVVALATSLGGRRRWLGLLGFATAFCWPLYMGLFSYYLATAIGFWILAFTFRVEIRTARHWFILGAALLAQVFCHVFAAALTGATVALICLWQAPSASERWRTLGRLALAGAPAASMVLLTVGGHTSHGGSSWSFLQRLTFVGRCFVSGPGWRCWPVVALAAAGLGVTIARGQWRRDPRQAVPLLVGALALVIAVVAPLHLPTWQFFSPRLLPFAVILLALLFPADRAGPAAAAVLTTYATACVLWAGWYHRDLRSKTADALAALDLPLHRSRFRLDLSLSLAPGAWGFLDRAVPFATPMFNIGPLYAVAHGGVTTAIFGGDPTAHALLWRKTLDQPAPPKPPMGSSRYLYAPANRGNQALRESVIVDLLSYAPDYEDVIFNGEKDDIRLLRSRGFQFDFERNGFAIARFVGCPAELEIDDGTGGRVLAAVEVRWHPNGHPIQVTELAPAPGRVLAIPGSPCGEVWVRVLFDRDGSHGPTKGDQVCAGSRPDGMVRFEIPAPGTRLRCSAGAPPR